MVVCDPENEPGLAMACPVSAYAPGRGVCDWGSHDGDVSAALGYHSCRVSCGTLLPRFLGRLCRRLAPRSAHGCRKGSGLTNHIEQFNNTLRQRLARLVRKSLAFSKSALMHDCCIRLFLGRYNRERAAILG